MRTNRTGTTRCVWPLWVLVALLPSCAEESAEEAIRAPLVIVAAVEGEDVVDRIEAVGELLAVERAEIAAEVDGRITELLIEEGEAVEEGTPLLRVDPERRQLEQADARAQAAEQSSAEAEAEREHRRIERLHARGAASVSQLDAAATRLSTARSRAAAGRARLGVADRALRYAVVRAPFSGSIARKHVSRGEYVRTGEALLELVALDPIEVEFHLPEADSSRLKLGTPVAVTVAPFPGEIFEAKVHMISPTIDAKTRTLRVKAQVTNPGGRLRPGLFARADLGVETRQGVPMVPEQAVLQRADGAVIFRFTADNRVERHVIETGVYRDGRVEVHSGLAVGDFVLTRGHTDLLDGAMVRAQYADGTPFAAPLASAAPKGETKP